MKEFLGRYRLVNKDTLIVQHRDLGFINFIPYLIARAWLSVVYLFRDTNGRDPRWITIPESIWVDYTEYNNLLYQIDEDMNYHGKEMLRLKAHRDSVEKMIKGEIKSLEQDEYTNRGYSEPFMIKISDLGPIGLRFERPKQLWKKILDPKSYGGGRKRASDGVKSTEEYTGNTETSTYTLEDYNPYRMSLENAAYEKGSDRLITYKEPNQQQKGKGKGGNGFNPKNRKWQKEFESKACHDERLALLQQGEDVSDFTPYK